MRTLQDIQREEKCGMAKALRIQATEGESSLAQAPGSALSREQLSILDHTEHRAAGGYYCGGGKDMDALVAAGLMEYAGRKSFVPDPYYKITSAGRAALRAQNTERSHGAKTKTYEH